MDTDTPDAPSALPAPLAPATPQTPAAAKSSRGSFAAIVLALVALGLGGAALWRNLADDAADRRGIDALQVLRDEIDATHRRIEQGNRDRDALRQRLADAESVNKSLREEVLGVTERARVLEDAVANLAEKRLSGRDALLLNEAEMLLLLSKERFELFHDPQAALAGYRLADTALAAIDDPAFATIRETIVVEENALDKLHLPSSTAGIAELERLRGQLDSLPATMPVETASESSRLWHVLSQFVRVSRDAAPATTRDRALARALVALDLREAEAALLARDLATFRAALTRVQAALTRQFDPNAPAVQTAHATLERLATVDMPEPPPELGAALKELRNLRSIRALGEAAPARTAAP